MHDWVGVLLAALLGTGGVGTLITVARGLGSLRAGARAHEREAVADLARARDDAEDRCRRATIDLEYWRGLAGRYAYQLVRAGVDPVPADPVPPSERIHPGGTP